MRNRTFLSWQLRDETIVSQGDCDRREVHTDTWLTCDDHASALPVQIFLFLPRLEVFVSDFVLFADQMNGFIVVYNGSVHLVGEVSQLQKINMLL